MAHAPFARGPNEFHFPPTGTRAPGPAVLLAIDDLSLPLRKDVCLYLSKPKVRPEPVLAPSPLESNAPDNLAAHFYGTACPSKFRPTCPGSANRLIPKAQADRQGTDGRGGRESAGA